MVWAMLVEQYQQLALSQPWLPALRLPFTPFELTAPLLALLLVFRTDKSYDRFKEGGEALGTIRCRLMNLVQSLLTSTNDRCARPVEDVDNVLSLIVEYHTWLCLVFFLQQQLATPAGDVEVLGKDRYIDDPATVSARLQVIDALTRRLELEPGVLLTPHQINLALLDGINLVPRLDEQQRSTYQTVIWEVSDRVAKCERILRAPIPLGYTRATLQFLSVWLTLLPFALTPVFEERNAKIPVPIVSLELAFEVPAIVGFIGLLFLTLEDVAVQIEEPFLGQRLQLQRMASWFAKDVEELRSTAVTRQERACRVEL